MYKMTKKALLEEILKRIELINWNMELIDHRTKVIEKQLKPESKTKTVKLTKKSAAGKAKE